MEFGFVQFADGSGDAFLHVSVVERSSHGSIPAGATLEVRTGAGPKGAQVKDIFVHASVLERAGIVGLTEGQRGAVDVIDGRKGPEAAGLRLI